MPDPKPYEFSKHIGALCVTRDTNVHKLGAKLGTWWVWLQLIFCSSFDFMGGTPLIRGRIGETLSKLNPALHYPLRIAHNRSFPNTAPDRPSVFAGSSRTINPHRSGTTMRLTRCWCWPGAGVALAASSSNRDKGTRLSLGWEPAVRLGDRSTRTRAPDRRTWARCTLSRVPSWSIFS